MEIQWFCPDARAAVSIGVEAALAAEIGRSSATALAGVLADFRSPVSYADGLYEYVYLASGVGPVHKWKWTSAEVLQAGVPAPEDALTLTGTGSGDIDGEYTAYSRFLDADGNPSDFSPISNTLNAADYGTVTYLNVPVPDDRRVQRRQILRNTAGQAITYYVDVDTEDLTSTTLTSTKTDDDLLDQTAVAAELADRYGVPTSEKPIIVTHQQRLFMAGEVSYQEGHLECTYGSTSMVGVGTNFNQSFVGRFVYIVGHDQPYEITAVSGQTLTVGSSFTGSTDLFNVYAVRSSPEERAKIFFSQLDSHDAWPALNSVSLPDSREEPTALRSSDSWLYIMTKKSIWRLTYQTDPSDTDDGAIYLAAKRGCLNHRCHVYVAGLIYVLDEHGVYAFDGSAAQPISLPIQDIFHQDAEVRINWGAAKWFHADHDQGESTIRWFVALAGSYLPKHALCYNYLTQNWWLEEYPFAVGGTAVMPSPVPRLLFGGPARKVLTFTGQLDGPATDAGTIRGTVTSATPNSLADTAASFPTSGLVGFPVSIVDGRGKNQTRLVASVSGTTVRVQQPWLIEPDTTSTYQFGAVPWDWRGGWQRFLERDGEQMSRRLEVIYQPTAHAAQLDLRFYSNHSTTPNDCSLDWPGTSGDSDGITMTKDEPDIEVDLTKPFGYAWVRLDGGQDNQVWRGSFFSLEMRGFSSQDPVRLYEVNLEGAAK